MSRKENMDSESNMELGRASGDSRPNSIAIVSVYGRRSPQLAKADSAGLSCANRWLTTPGLVDGWIGLPDSLFVSRLRPLRIAMCL